MDKFLLALPGIVILATALTGAFFVARSEKRLLQEGHCGLPWKSFDTDSSGAIGIECRKCGTYGGWISFHRKKVLNGRVEVP